MIIALDPKVARQYARQIASIATVDYSCQQSTAIAYDRLARIRKAFRLDQKKPANLVAF